jgi:AmiR/NasT family two-component response regulator
MWFMRAKPVLQTDRGMSEEEAHAFLRKSSRQSRRRFVDIAKQVIEGKV